MSGDDLFLTPSVLWAQRSGAIFMTVCVEDCSNPEVQILAEKFYFNGVGGPDKQPYRVTIPLYKEIDPEKSIYSARGRIIEVVLKKKEEGPYWPRLTKDRIKYHWLKIDFDRWRDEDDTDEENEGGCDPDDLEEMMKQMGGLQKEDGKPSFDDLNGSDSDDGDLPDLE